MATYEGQRLDAGGVSVTVDGEPLPVRLDLVNHSPTGFEWGYGGSGPAQLALALLAHHLIGKAKNSAQRATAEQRAVRQHQGFKFAFVARLDGSWKLNSADIDRFLEKRAVLP